MAFAKMTLISFDLSLYPGRPGAKTGVLEKQSQSR